MRICIDIDSNELCIKVYDQGEGFDLDAVPHPDLDHPKEGGLGIFLMRNFMDSVEYHRIENGNLLIMKKTLE